MLKLTHEAEPFFGVKTESECLRSAFAVPSLYLRSQKRTKKGLSEMLKGGN
jgi:hypothetical protein